MGPQFAHIETYSSSRSKLAKAKSGMPGGDRHKWTVDEILKEAERDPAACPHVEAPSPPLVLKGGIAELREAHEAMLADVKARTGRKVRADQRTLMTLIASHPLRPQDLVEPENARVVQHWRDLVLRHAEAWAKESGGELHTVVEHLDESHVHMHLYILPTGVDAKANALHPGERAKAEAVASAREQGMTPADALKLGNRAYRARMREWQDEVWNAVGAPSGLTRDGPRRARYVRCDWSASQRSVAAAATAQMALDGAMKQLDSAAAELDQLRCDRDQALADSAKIRADAQARIRDAEAALQRAEEAQRKAELEQRRSEQAHREAIGWWQQKESNLAEREQKARGQIEANKEHRAELLEREAVLAKSESALAAESADVRQKSRLFDRALEVIRNNLSRFGLDALWQRITRDPDVKEARELKKDEARRHQVDPRQDPEVEAPRPRI